MELTPSRDQCVLFCTLRSHLFTGLGHQGASHKLKQNPSLQHSSLSCLSWHISFSTSVNQDMRACDIRRDGQSLCTKACFLHGFRSRGQAAKCCWSNKAANSASNYCCVLVSFSTLLSHSVRFWGPGGAKVRLAQLASANTGVEPVRLQLTGSQN